MWQKKQECWELHSSCRPGLDFFILGLLWHGHSPFPHSPAGGGSVFPAFTKSTRLARSIFPALLLVIDQAWG